MLAGPATERLFFGAFPCVRTQARLHALARTFTNAGGGRPTPAANIHLTLRFLGEVPVELRDTVVSLGRQLSGQRFILQFARCEVWGRSNLLVSPAAALPQGLHDLVRDLGAVVTRAGLAAESRRYRPHLTIARKVSRTTPAPVVDPPLPWEPAGFALCRSQLESTGARYAVVEDFPLG